MHIRDCISVNNSAMRARSIYENEYLIRMHMLYTNAT